MFQYAAGLIFNKFKKSILVLDLDELQFGVNENIHLVKREFDLDIFQIGPLLNKREFYRKKSIFLISNYKLRKILIYILSKFSMRIIINDKKKYIKNPIFISGGFQCAKIFFRHRNRLKKIFSIKKNLLLKNKINIKPNFVCVNVRAKDYLISDYHNICDNNYYKKAFSICIKKIKNPKYFVFSDDIEYSKKLLKNYKGLIFISHKYKGFKFANYLWMMSRFQNFIIPNSTFAWWAAFLSLYRYPFVICPKKWNSLQKEPIHPLVFKNWVSI